MGRKSYPGDRHALIRLKAYAGVRDVGARKLLLKGIKGKADVEECVIAIQTLGKAIEKSPTPLTLKKVRGIGARGKYVVHTAKLGKGCKLSARSERKQALKGWK